MQQQLMPCFEVAHWSQKASVLILGNDENFERGMEIYQTSSTLLLPFILSIQHVQVHIQITIPFSHNVSYETICLKVSSKVIPYAN